MIDAPLRAFLMVRSVDGTWTVTVCRDLVAIIHAWKIRKEPERDVAVLHIGFDRPPSNSFDDIAQSHSGRLLLTAAAKFTLPKPFVSSVFPIGVVENIDVFIGLQGWGYSIDDPTDSLDEMGKSRTDAKVRQAVGWVALFSNEHSDDAKILSEHGVYDEASYLTLEADLERNLRHRSGLYRLHHTVGVNCEDPCEIARAAPPWLAIREIASLELPVRANNVFRTNQIKTVADLGQWSPKTLMSQQNFGRKSLRETVQALTIALNEGPVAPSTPESIPDSQRLIAEIRKSLLKFSVRERDILVRRLGFEEPAETLQEIADDYGVSRERIRQIEAKATNKWIRDSFWDDILEQKISRLLIGRTFPLPISGIEAIDPWFEGVSEHRIFFKNLIRTVCGDRIFTIPIDGLDYFSLMTQETWERTLSEASSLLSSGVGQEWSEDYARSLVQGLLSDTAREFGILLWEKSSRFCHFSITNDGSRTLTSYGRGADQLVEAILAEAEAPLHYTEIVEQAELRNGTILDPRRAHTAAANVGYLFGRGTYGLMHHVPLSFDQMSAIRNESEDLICSERSGRQWHSSEILAEISERLGGAIDGLDKYVLDIALSESELLRSLGKMTWVAVATDANEDLRIDVHQAVISIVQAAGRPLSTSEIRERLTAVRGVNDTFQIYPIDPLIRMKPRMWGINDRDIAVTRDDQREMLEKIIEILDQKQIGIHASEISKFINMHDCPPEAFLSIASQDSRVKISQGQYIFRAEWDGPRRETIKHAITATLESSDGPLSLEEISISVDKRTGRNIEKRVVSGLLQTLEATFDEQNKRWQLGSYLEEHNVGEN